MLLKIYPTMGQWKHGEAVSVGMVVAAKISSSGWNYVLRRMLIELASILKALGLPTEPPDFALDEYIVSMQRDKKVKQGHLTLVLNRGIGKVILHKVTDISSVFSSIL